MVRGIISALGVSAVLVCAGVAGADVTFTPVWEKLGNTDVNSPRVMAWDPVTNTMILPESAGSYLVHAYDGASGATKANLSTDGLVIDTARRIVSRDGEPIRLTPKEYDLLILLSRHAGRVVTHKALLTAVWGPAHGEDLHYLRVFIGQLRQKIERDPTHPTIVRTEPGVGYRLTADQDA